MVKLRNIILICMVLVVAACQQNVPESDIDINMPAPGEEDNNQDSEMVVEDDPEKDTVDEKDTKVFMLTGQNFKFMMDGEDNPDIRVNKGDWVRIEFESIQGFHDWVLDEFDAATEQVMAGEDGMVYVEFLADQAGTFEYYCSVGSHRANGMRGNFVVEE